MHMIPNILETALIMELGYLIIPSQEVLVLPINLYYH